MAHLDLSLFGHDDRGLQSQIERRVIKICVTVQLRLDFLLAIEDRFTSTRQSHCVPLSRTVKKTVLE